MRKINVEFVLKNLLEKYEDGALYVEEKLEEDDDLCLADFSPKVILDSKCDSALSLCFDNVSKLSCDFDQFKVITYNKPSKC